MSTRLVTQLSDESPRVLLVGEETSLRRKIEAFLLRQGLDVDTAISLSAQKDLKKILSKKFYKIIVVGKGLNLKENLSCLKHKTNVLVINLVSTIESDSYLSTHSSLIVGQDVVPEGKSSWPFFNFVTKNISKGVLLDPNLTVFLQSEENFFKSIKKLTLSPTRQRVLVRGRKHSSEIVVSEIKRLSNLFNPSKSIQIKKDVKKALHKSFASFEVAETEIEALPSLLEESVRSIGLKNTTNSREKQDFHQRVLSEPKKEVIDIPIIKKEEAILIPRLEVPESSSPVVEKPIEVKSSETVDDKLGKIFKVKRVDQKVELVKNIVKETKKIKKKTKKKKFLFGMGTLFTIIATSMLVFTGLFLISTSNLEKELTQLFFKFSQEESSTEVDYSKIKQSSAFLEKQINLYEQFLPPEVFIDSRNLIEISQKISEYDEYKKEFNSDVDDLVTSFLGKDLLEDILSSQKPAKTAQAYNETASRLLSRLNDFKDTQTQEDKQEKITKFISYVESQKSSLLAYQQLSPIFELLFGKDGKKTYAVVFQNNQELRPTGGFIQAVALLTVDQGMLVDSQVFSSYELDKKLGGSVVPPDDIIRLLGENKWYLRDSNWDPDFANSSKQISWFLEQETNRKIDGVVGINLFVLKNLLKEMGPLEMEEYNEIITDKNIFERSEFHSEIKLVESSDVEDYQSNLMKYLLRDLVTKGQENPGGILTALSKSLEEKQMTIYMNNEDLSQTFSLLGWSGELINPQCPNQLSTLPCQVDSLIINESNVGVNKANSHTSREDSHVIEIKETMAKHTRNIVLNNSAFSNSWPKGGYKAYFRVFMPLNIKSLSIKIDGEDLEEDKYKVVDQSNNKVAGILIETPIKTKKNIEINYVVPIEFSLPHSYVFFNQKQPGTEGVLPQVIINHDPSLSPTLIAPQAQVQGNSIIFDNLDEDHAFVGVSFK